MPMKALHSARMEGFMQILSLRKLERGPFFEHFYRKTDLVFSESLATAGLFLLAFFQCSHEKTKNAEELFFRGVGI